MKTNVILFAVILFSCSSKSIKSKQDKISQSEITIQVEDTLSIDLRLRLLKEYASKISEKDIQKRFFEIFPNNFKDFRDLFGYEDIHAANPNFGPLYMDSQYYIDVFFTKLDVDKDMLNKKAIDIAVEGQWQADGVNIFQLYIRDEAKEYSNYYAKELEKRSNDEIENFWSFLFAGPHPENYKDDFEILYERYNEINPQITELMKQSYEKLLSEHDGHGH
jgi:hypothetical protein